MQVSRISFPLQLRQTAERVLEGICVPWDEVTYLTWESPGGEKFRKGSLTKTVQRNGSKLKLFRAHDHSRAVGTVVKLDPRHPDGLWGAFRIARTAAGDEVLNEVAEGVLDAFSIGFRALNSVTNPEGTTVITEAALHEVSICPLGAYEGAKVLATRSPAMSELPPPPFVNLAPLPYLRHLY